MVLFTASFSVRCFVAGISRKIAEVGLVLTLTISNGATQTAVPAAGSKVLVIADSELQHNNRTLRIATAGEQFSVAGADSGSGRVFVFVDQPKPAARIIASLPIASLTQVDAGTQVSTSPISVEKTAPATVNHPPPASAPPVDGSSSATLPTTADGYISATDLAAAFKSDKVAASGAHRSKNLKISGVIERIDVLSGSLSSGPSPSLTLSTGPGLPRVRAKLSPLISRDQSFYRLPAFRDYWGYYWWQDRKIEYRVEGSSKLMARTVYKGKRTTNYSTGGTYTTRYRHESEWFPLLTAGQEIALQGVCDGMMMDVQILDAELHGRSN